MARSTIACAVWWWFLIGLVVQTADIGNDFSDRMYEGLGRQRIEAI